MSLEENNISLRLDNMKRETMPIIDLNSLKDADETMPKQLQRLLKRYAAQDAHALQRNEERREQGERANVDEVLPPTAEPPTDYEPFTATERKMINEYTEAFHCYSKVLQYTLNKATK
eukprot:2842729-Amphidinium_carterae.2